MSGQQSTDASSMTGAGESSETVVEVNIKTLDSQVFSFQVDKNILVSEFKEKIASEVGLPVGQQRLIFRGKVLKDDHTLSEYHVDNGHTLHLVARQPTASQAPSGTSPGEPSSNNGQVPNTTGLPTRMGQISHSVVLGTLNVGDQEEGAVPDISRVIGAVLNSFGLGGQTATGAMGAENVMLGPQATVEVSSQIPVSQGNEMDGTPANTGTHNQARTRGQPGQAFPGQSFPQVLQIPMGAAVQIPVGVSIPIPSLDVPIPDSLRTISEFMSRMELALSQNGSQPNEAQTNTGDQPSFDLPTNARGLPSPDSLMLVLRHAQRLLGDHIISALSHITRRLEQEGSSTDPTVRGQIQRETMQLGIAMQHLGALLLELGRTILTLRMGQSPAEAYVNAGPAVYISPSGPNPIMVQPFPLQTSSLFGRAPSNSANLGPVGIGATPRHVNIHIHTAVGPRAAPNADGAQGRQNNRTGPGNSSRSRARDPRNANAAAVPPQPSVTVSSASQTGVSVPQVSAVVEEINAQIRNLVQARNLAPTDGQEANSAIQDPSYRSDAGDDGANSQLGDLADTGDRGLSPVLMGEKSDAEKQKDVPPCGSDGGCNDPQSGEAALKAVFDAECAPVPAQGSDNIERATGVPLGLGLGGLQPKRKSKQPKIQDTTRDGTSSNSSVQGQQTLGDGQQVMQSLASMMNQRDTSNVPLSGQLPSGIERMIGRGQGGNNGGQIDVANAMTEVLNTPAFSGLLGGVSQQTGIGSPNALRSMLDQFTRNPAMMDTVNQLAQQFDGQDIGNMFSGMGRGQGGGGFDLAGMVQQMMPIVSQALGGGPTTLQQPGSSVLPDHPPESNVRSFSIDDTASDEDLQIDLQPVLQRIENQDPPQEIFRSLVATVASLNDGGSDDLVNELCNEEEGLAGEFMNVLLHDLRAQLQGENDPSDKS